MPYLRLSKAHQEYRCDGCGEAIIRSARYFRSEPHPWARRRGQATTRRLCPFCVLDEAQLVEFYSDLRELTDWWRKTKSEDRAVISIPSLVQVVDITSDIIALLAQEPDRLRDLNPAAFEGLVCNRLTTMGLAVERVGPSTYSKDGGIDIVAWPRSSVFPFLMAVQVKHIRSPDRKIGPEPIRSLLGTIQLHGFNAGLLVTNSTFTPDARWAAEQRGVLMRLRDMDDLRRWLREEFVADSEWRGIPKSLELCPGVLVRLGK
jgi:HJR/Mrr/RecB family endonuclease